MKRLAIVLFPVLLAGCASGVNSGASFQALYQESQDRPAREVATSDLLVQSPAWAGAIKKATQAQERGAIRQEIALDGAPREQRVIEVAMGIAKNAGVEALRAPTDADIADEIKTKFPDVAMRVAQTSGGGPGASRGLAIGRGADGTNCLYAWRWTENVRTVADPSGIAAAGAFFSGNATPASLRIRLCTKYVSLDDLASLAEQIRFVSLPELDRIVADLNGAKGADPVTTNESLRPGLESQLACPSNVSTRHISRTKTGSGRVSAGQLASVRPVKTAPLSAPAGVQYLAPVSAIERSPSSSALTRVDLQARAKSLDLPDAAFRGPSSRPSAGETAANLGSN